jgi:glucose/arabinose dehydrogenase
MNADYRCPSHTVTTRRIAAGRMARHATPACNTPRFQCRLAPAALLVALCASGALACDADDDAGVGNGGSGVAINPNGAGPTRPPGMAAAAPQAASDLDAGPGDERNVFRPAELPATPERIAGLRAPDGFTVAAFASGLGEARMLVARGASLYVTRPEPGDVLRLDDTDGDGRADETRTLVSGLPLVHGITFGGDSVYLATPTDVLRAPVDAAGDFGALTTIIDDLPDGGQHPRRTLGIGPDGRLFISVGSSCDACPESNPEHATLLVAALDGSTRSVVARGLRNTIGFDWQPGTDTLWGMDHGSDWRGDDTPPEELNAIIEGADYGWPYCYGARQVDPIIEDPPGTTKQAYCADTTAPTLATQAHNAPIGMTFYRATSFPEAYRDDAFIAMHGSWNRLPPTGYKVVRLVFEAGVPQRFEDFLTGFLVDDGAATFGRPAGIAAAPDGALFVSDDMNGIIYRIAFGGPTPDAGLPTPLEPPPDAGSPGAPETGAPAAPDAG